MRKSLKIFLVFLSLVITFTNGNTKVPEFPPDNEIIRGDLLDFANEIEKFDNHLTQTLQYLDSLGMLENMLVIESREDRYCRLLQISKRKILIKISNHQWQLKKYFSNLA